LFNAHRLCPAPLSSAEIRACPVKDPPVAAYYLALTNLTFQRSPRSRERCSSPISATDLRHEHPCKRSVDSRVVPRPSPCGKDRFAARLAARGPGGTSLDGEATSFGVRHPLSDGPARDTRSLRSLRREASLVPGGAAIRQPLRRRPRRGRCLPSIESMTRPLTSLSYPPDDRAPKRVAVRESTRPDSAAVSSKTTTFPDQDAFHRCVLPPPRLRGASSRACHRSPGFATERRLPAPLRPSRFRGLDPHA